MQSSTLRYSHRPVISCLEAAIVRGVALKQELKTLLLKAGHKRVAAHIRGSDRLSSRATKSMMQTKRLRFMNSSELRGLGLEPGMVNPWNVPFCEYHLICLRVLANPVMTTNTGVRHEAIAFAPSSLLRLQNPILGNFTQP